MQNQIKEVDLLVIGGGITGAGVALIGAELGLKVLLVEQQDYAWGSSSRSSKMVHGGLRYLAQGSVHLTKDSLREREWLLRELPELVKRQTYLFPLYKKQFPGRFVMGAALYLYDFLAGIKNHHWLSLTQVKAKFPFLNTYQMRGAYAYSDAVTDDSRLVLRVLQEAWAKGAESLNYMQAVQIEELAGGYQQVWLRPTEPHGGSVNPKTEFSESLSQVEKIPIRAKHVVNATGAWAEQFLRQATPTVSQTDYKIRPLRGSHLIFPYLKLPVNEALSLQHPQDHRLLFVFPWQGCTVVGTTDLDHQQATDEAYASQAEIDYLFACLAHYFPDLQLSRQDLISTQAGIRPIVTQGESQKDPSAESRDHQIWIQQGVLTLSGGKLTTFRTMALDLFLHAGILRPIHYRWLRKNPLKFSPDTIPKPVQQAFAALCCEQPEAEALQIAWQWSIQHEQVKHLDDLMLRRTHLGNRLPEGGQDLLLQHKVWLQQQFQWSETTWQTELARYQAIYTQYYSAG